MGTTSEHAKVSTNNVGNQETNSAKYRLTA
jgi:hypothetical protein